jgi:hypothetical protein
MQVPLQQVKVLDHPDLQVALLAILGNPCILILVEFSS